MLMSYPHHHQANKVFVRTSIEVLEPNTKILLNSIVGGNIRVDLCGVVHLAE